MLPKEEFAGGRIALALSMFADKADDSDGCDLDVNKQAAKGSRFRRRQRLRRIQSIRSISNTRLIARGCSSFGVPESKYS